MFKKYYFIINNYHLLRLPRPGHMQNGPATTR